MHRVALIIIPLAISASATAGDADNIQACVKRANEFAGIKLSEFDASYEGNIFSQSTAKWKNAYCEVKLSSVYNLQVNGKQVIFNGYAGKDSYDLNKALNEKTESAINQLRSRIALLEQRMGQVSTGLKTPKPDHAGLVRFIDEGIEKSLGAQRQASASTPPRADIPKNMDDQSVASQNSLQPAPTQPIPKQPDTQPELRPTPSITSGEVDAAIRASDDFSSYRQSFMSATAKLIENGTCTLAELKEIGGWVKSQNNKNQPIYFTYCGGMTMKNRIYIDASSGNVFR